MSSSPDPTAYFEFQQRGGIADLSARTKLRLTGEDRVRYLNGQVTTNVNRATEHESLRACVTTAKGKLCADVFIATIDAGRVLLVDAEPKLRESLTARLERYIVADDVALEDVTDTLGLLHLLPSTGAGIHSYGPDGAIRSHRFGREGYDFFLSPDATRDALRETSQQCVLLDDSLLETLRLEAGIPRWGRELGEDTLPPEAGLDRTHIDYHKGCYIGQEVISRIKSVGHVNRELTGFLSDDGAPLVAGTAIFSSAESDARPCGTLTSAAWSFALDRPIALGYLKRGAPTGGLFARPVEATGPGVRVTPHPLPFVA